MAAVGHTQALLSRQCLTHSLSIPALITSNPALITNCRHSSERAFYSGALAAGGQRAGQVGVAQINNIALQHSMTPMHVHAAAAALASFLVEEWLALQPSSSASAHPDTNGQCHSAAQLPPWHCWCMYGYAA